MHACMNECIVTTYKIILHNFSTIFTSIQFHHRHNYSFNRIIRKIINSMKINIYKNTFKTLKKLVLIL